MAEMAAGSADRRLPPVTELAVVSLSLIVVGGIYLAAHIPGPVSMTPAIALWAVAALLLVVNAGLLRRLPSFAWGRFRQVGGWALLAYGISAGMLEYVFVTDRVPATELIWLTLMLIVYALDIPLILAFSVARYQSSD